MILLEKFYRRIFGENIIKFNSIKKNCSICKLIIYVLFNFLFENFLLLGLHLHQKVQSNLVHLQTINRIASLSF